MRLCAVDRLYLAVDLCADRSCPPSHRPATRASLAALQVDRMIGLAKDGSLAARRKALGYMYDKNLVHALFEQAPERYADRNGGYCRVVRTMPRQGDNAKMAVIELV